MWRPLTSGARPNSGNDGLGLTVLDPPRLSVAVGQALGSFDRFTEVRHSDAVRVDQVARFVSIHARRVEMFCSRLSRQGN